MFGIVSSTLNDRLVVELGEPLFKFIPDALEADGLCWERTASVLSFEEKALVGKPWTIGGRHVPNPVYVLPSD